jgi:5-methylcytosine-specific restriction endonuclease McrA
MNLVPELMVGDRQPKILRLNLAGLPIEWLNWQEAVCLYARDLVAWSLGDIVRKVHGGLSRATGARSLIELPSIIACGGGQMARPRTNYPLTNPALFARDRFHCLYCSRQFAAGALTRDHVVPLSRGGRDRWQNVVAACRRCNQFKGNRLLEDIGWELVALPYRPNNAEYLALINSRRILADQMDFLAAQFSSNSRWLT